MTADNQAYVVLWTFFLSLHMILNFGERPLMQIKLFKCKKIYSIYDNFLKNKNLAKHCFKELGLLTVPCIYILRCLMFVKNNYQNLMNQQHEHNYNTRYNTNFQYPRHRLTLVQKTPQYFGRKLFNKLPQHLENIIKEDCFKNKLDFLLTKMYNTVEEFLNE